MTFTSNAASKAVYGDGLEELRAAFVARLLSDRVQFVALSAALAHAEEDAGSIFLDLRDRAHKIRGAAAVFEIAALAAAARALEIAAIAAGAAHAGNTDANVWDAIVELVRLIGVAHQTLGHASKAGSRTLQSVPNLAA
jgi:HPt (histidine-containing phosphotransfer) domain-containing protein